MEWLWLNLTKGLRFVELCVTLVLLSWLLPRLPFAISFLKQVSLFLSTPLFVLLFLLSNAIIATLFLNSPRFHLNNNDQHHHDDDDDDVDKHILSHPSNSTHHIILSTTKDDTDESHDSPKLYRRTLSEKFTTQEPPHKLRRSHTTDTNHVQHRPQSMYPHDRLTSEEFQRTVEAFIANQIRFRRQESLSIVLHNHS